MKNAIENESIFEDTPIAAATLYVPEAMLAAYQSTSPWSGFGTIQPLLSLSDLIINLGGQSQISINGVPEYTDSKTLDWTSSNPDVAIVDAEGNVTALAVGEATITATATDGSGVSASCQVTVTMPTLGDANGDGKISITDVVAIANYILGKRVEGFRFTAADMDGNGKITITDAVAVVNKILDGGASAKERGAAAWLDPQ